MVLHLLAQRRFLPLFLTQALGAMNDNLYRSALAIVFTFQFAATHAYDPAMLVSISTAIFMAPFFLFSATAGMIADRSDKSVIIRTLKLVEIIIMIAGAIGFYLGHVEWLLAVLFLMGTQSAFFGPLKYAILPDHLPQNALVGGNALIEAGTFLAILCGTLAGSLIISTERGLILLPAACVVVAMIGYLSSRRIPPTERHHLDLRVSWNIFHSSAVILLTAWHQPALRAPMLGVAWFWMLGTVFVTQLPLFSKDYIGGNEEVVALLLAAFSIGIAVGSLLCQRLLRGIAGTSTLVPGAVVIAAGVVTLWLMLHSVHPASSLIGLDAFWQTPLRMYLLLALVAVAVGAGLFIVPLYTLLQTLSPQPMRSRIIAASNILDALVMVASSLIVAALYAQTVSLRDIWLTLGLLTLPVAFWLVHALKTLSIDNSTPDTTR